MLAPDLFALRQVRSSRLWILIILLGMLQGCIGHAYHPTEVAVAEFLQRAKSQQQGGVRITVAVPTALETKALTGLDLYAQGIQPIWIEVENSRTIGVRTALRSIDEDYFSPIEVSYMNRRLFSREGAAAMERWFYENGLPRRVAPGESQSGFVYTHLTPGTKGFNLDIFSNQQSFNYTFFVPLPDFKADYTQVDYETLYADTDLKDLSDGALKLLLENQLPCCASSKDGEGYGAPLNVVLVGSGLAVRRAMLRGRWHESAAGDPDTANARLQYQFGRTPDAVFAISRPDGNETIELRLWAAPWTVESEPVWLGQTVFREKNPTLIERFAQESLAADLDSAQRFVYQNIWYNQSLRKGGFVSGVGESTESQPHFSYTGAEYFSHGERAVLFLSEVPVSMDETRLLWTTPGAEPSEFERRELFQGQRVLPPNDRLYVQGDDSLRVTTAVPSAAESEKIFGSNLYRKNIQPVWVQVENLSESRRLLTPLGLDSSYYTPRESARRSRGNNITQSLDESFQNSGIVRLIIPPNSVRSGYIFSRVDEGTKTFNVDVLGGGKTTMMTFHVPVPGLKLDHYEVDVNNMYPADELKHVDQQQLLNELEAMPCCVTGKAGKGSGDPLNLVFVADVEDLYYTFMRAGWDETETVYSASLFKTVASALTGGAYRYSPVSALYVFGRSQDAAMQRARGSIHERNHLRVWLTPLRHEGKPVWIGQISRDIGVHFTWKTITTHKIDPDVDETREFLIEDLAYAQAISKIAYVDGVGEASYDQPRGNLTGDPYFSDGRRVIMWVATEPTTISEIEILKLRSSDTDGKKR